MTAGTEVASIETGPEQTTERTGSRRNRNNRRGRRDRVENSADEANRPFVPNDDLVTNQASVNTETTTVNTASKPVETVIVESIAAPTSSEAPKAKADNRRQRPAKASTANAETATLSTSDASPAPVSEVAEPSDKPASKVDKKRPARTRKAKTEAKPVDLAASGLQLVETKADMPKIATPAEAVKPRTPRKAASWQKNAKSEATAEPMVMVETKNK
ncbi:MAG: hypothetical protein EXR42_02330 [Methylotenera sp.]|nr:hypothetical protein [Methylotenera sp.]